MAGTQTTRAHGDHATDALSGVRPPRWSRVRWSESRTVSKPPQPAGEVVVVVCAAGDALQGGRVACGRRHVPSPVQVLNSQSWWYLVHVRSEVQLWCRSCAHTCERRSSGCVEWRRLEKFQQRCRAAILECILEDRANVRDIHERLCFTHSVPRAVGICLEQQTHRGICEALAEGVQLSSAKGWRVGPPPQALAGAVRTPRHTLVSTFELWTRGERAGVAGHCSGQGERIVGATVANLGAGGRRTQQQPRPSTRA